MVRGYFSEMACVIGECTRVLKPNARLFMVKRQCSLCRREHFGRHDFIRYRAIPRFRGRKNSCGAGEKGK